ncbi:hypothetical protein BDV96DRAFT_644662 [Lophiotrema nucula]|uniref:MYND-type domain-containing protein n=1 Tax=Lophiotrema nucula TaxID=690887 RepID=A0A6A5ZDT1_9PLEO|nr:hypothetical protein BDV96DRAFT_644662 [Lophiotrema nucula]
MPPRSVCLNVFTTTRSDVGKDADVKETVAEVEVEQEVDGVRMGDKDADEAQNFAAQLTTDAAKCAVCEASTSPTGGSLLRCSRCRSAFYCNTACQKADWKAHKKSCGPRRMASYSTLSSPNTPSASSPIDHSPAFIPTAVASSVMDVDAQSLDQPPASTDLANATSFPATDNKVPDSLRKDSLTPEEPAQI